jgi:hypothetical protein
MQNPPPAYYSQNSNSEKDREHFLSQKISGLQSGITGAA